MTEKKLIIIGGGPAGLAAAVAAADRGVDPSDMLVLERDSEPGGILNQCIHAGFGLHRFGEELTGPEYSGRYVKMARERNIPILTDAMALQLTHDRRVTFVSPATGYTTVKADAVILAMGCRERTRGALGTPGTRPAGVYTAGCAQRYVNIEGYMPGRRVVILGSGDIGLIMARRMTLEGAKVLAVCEIMPYSGGLARNIEQCLNDFGIPLKLSHTVVNIHGKERVEGVTIAAVDEQNGRRPIPGTEEYIPCDTLLLSVGLIPENELTRGAGIGIDRMTNGASVNQFRETSAPGIYACGNVLHVHDLVDHVSSESFRAGEAAARYAMGLRRTGKEIAVRDGRGVRGTVPQKIVLDGENGEVSLMFRPDRVYRDHYLTVYADGKAVSSVKKMILTPGEMAVQPLHDKLLAACVGAKEITLAVTEEKAV